MLGPKWYIVSSFWLPNEWWNMDIGERRECSHVAQPLSIVLNDDEEVWWDGRKFRTYPSWSSWITGSMTYRLLVYPLAKRLKSIYRWYKDAIVIRQALTIPAIGSIPFVLVEDVIGQWDNAAKVPANCSHLGTTQAMPKGIASTTKSIL